MGYRLYLHFISGTDQGTETVSHELNVGQQQHQDQDLRLRNLQVLSLDHQETFCREPNRKYFKLSGSYVLRGNYSALLMRAKGAINNVLVSLKM